MRAVVVVALSALLVLPGCGGATRTVTVPARTPSTRTTPATSYERYRTGLYSAEVPSGWTREADGQRYAGFVESKWRDPADANSSITIDASPNETMDAGAKATSVRAKSELQQASGYQEIAFEAVTVAGRSGWRWTWRQAADQRVDYFLNECSTGVAVLGSTSPERFSQLEAIFARVADSVRVSCSSPTPTPAPGPTTTTSTTTTTSPSQTCRVKAWYSGTGFSANYGYIHFKCVDERSGRTVEEALGSDNFDLRQEAQAARRTAKRVELVDQLRGKLESQGWQQIGTVNGGEWYQLRFGR